jgi:hypothetical protein
VCVDPWEERREGLTIGPSPKSIRSAGELRPLRASTMPLLAPSAVFQEAENPDRTAVKPALEVTAQQLRRMQISEFSAS